MSKYSNVDGMGLKNAADTALNELADHNLTDSKTLLSDTSSLQSGASEVLLGAIDAIASSGLSGSVQTISDKLSKLSSAGSYVMKIKDAEKTIADLELAVYYQDTETYTDENGEKQTRTVTKIDYTVLSQISQLKEQIVEYEGYIDALLV